MSHAGRPPVGSLEWERSGGPPLSLPQCLGLLAGTAAVLLGDARPRLRWALSRGGITAPCPPRKIDLTRWAPPRTEAVCAAEEHLRAVASPHIIDHSFRTYYFTAIRYEVSHAPRPLDREALCVAALLHDTGLFDPDRQGCFTVAGASKARQITESAGWPTVRQDSVALAITTNLNPFVSARRYGPARLVRQEARRNPGCRFACFGPIFPTAVRWSTFSNQRPAA